ncbi:MAG: hypothetical protein CYPHOPRED_005210 [Cyphobasidiales sp. Tagirdzhanova-0007]|nr:MAG: hypothetical protein CYPHOPRED_005210 [Cyphobasidiales sp. Tagirdzhanova-0007]
MAKEGSSTQKSVPKDELAMKEAGNKTTPSGNGSLKVDGSNISNSSSRKVRISEDSPAQGVKRRSSSSGRRKSRTQDVENGEVEVLGEGEGEGESQAEKKFSPKHKDGKRQPEKSALKKDSGRKRKTASDLDDEPETSTMAADEGQAAQEEEQENNNDNDNDNAENAEIDFLAGFESGSEGEDGEDSSDEEEKEEEAQEEAVSAKELPKPKQGKGESRPKGKKESRSKPGVIYLGRIPHGFHEDEMKSYFTQFGDVTRLRLSRNRSTGASKHYAFIEFEHASVAQIVSETMDNYLLHGHLLQCKVVPSEQVHPKMWMGANRKFRPVPKGRVERLRHNASKTQEQKEAIVTRLVKREDAKRARLRELGIEYDFDGYAKTLPSKQRKDQKEGVKAVQAAKKLEDQVRKDTRVAESAKNQEPRLKRARKAK